jgi:sugar phosphate isomerase/epimerase
MILGYNTNGLAHHDPFDALKLLAETGYRSVALTVDHGWLSPRDVNHKVQLQELKASIDELNLGTVIETGARFLLDPNTKHAPTLLDDDPIEVGRRIDFLKYCIDVAEELGSGCVSMWSGAKPPELSFTDAMSRLVIGLREVCEYAEERKVDIGFEPEPGMLIDTTGRFERMLHLYDSPRLKMTLDIGHLFCLSELPIAQYIEKWSDRIINVHIEDIKAGVHEHLMFGEGQIHFPPVIESLVSVGYDKAIHVELSRHSHNAAEIVRRAFEFLNPIIEDAKANQFDV